MIISYRHKFTFLHCPKTAGSSINLALAPYVGPFDIVLGSRGERIAAELPLNLRTHLDALHAKPVAGLLRSLGLRSGDRIKTLRFQEQRYDRLFGPIVDHPSAAQVREFDPLAWQRHFKFTFVRNPYSRLASLYVFLRQKMGENPISFPAFLGDLINSRGDFARWSHLVDTWPLYTIGDRIAVDFVGRQENMDHDFEELCRRLQLPQAALGQSKVMPRYNFRELYDPPTRRLVQMHCGRELEHFGYRFDE